MKNCTMTGCVQVLSSVYESVYTMMKYFTFRSWKTTVLQSAWLGWFLIWNIREEYILTPVIQVQHIKQHILQLTFAWNDTCIKKTVNSLDTLFWHKGIFHHRKKKQSTRWTHDYIQTLHCCSGNIKKKRFIMYKWGVDVCSQRLSVRPARRDPKHETCLDCRSRLWRLVRRNNVRSDPPQLQRQFRSDYIDKPFNNRINTAILQPLNLPSDTWPWLLAINDKIWCSYGAQHASGLKRQHHRTSSVLGKCCCM